MAPPSLLDQLDSIASNLNLNPSATHGSMVVASYGHDDSGQEQQRAAAIKENFAVLSITGKL